MEPSTITTQTIFAELCWCLILLLLPISVIIFPYIKKTLTNHFYHKMHDLSDEKQYKITLKFIYGSFYTIAWIHGMCIWFIWPLPTTMYQIKHAKLTYTQDKLFKIGITIVLSTYVIDLIHGRLYIKRLMFCHHIASLIMFLLVFPNPDILSIFSFVNVLINRFYAMIFGVLLTFIFLLQYASLYYYLGNKQAYKMRFGLYIIGLFSQIVFVFGQISASVLIQIVKYKYNQFEIVKLIVIIIFECCVLPAQLWSFYDIYCILKYKIIQIPVKDEENIISSIKIESDPKDQDIVDTEMQKMDTIASVAASGQ